MPEMTMDDLQAMLATRDNALAGAINAYATRPQKTSVITDTTSTSTPYALADMLATRGKIGAATRELDDALKMRESTAYSLANALASVPQQQGYGSWLTDFARSFGGGMSTPFNARVDRAQKKYESEMKDLADILAFDKAMGETTTQTQNQVMGYTPMEYGTAGTSKATGVGGIGNDIVTKEIAAGTLADLYKTIDANPIAFSALSGVKQDSISSGLKSGVETLGVTNLGRQEFAYLQNIMPKGFAGAINTAKEQEIMRPYTTKFQMGRGSEKKAAIKGMMSSIYDEYERLATAQGLKMPVSKSEYIKSRLDTGREINASWFSDQSTPMYKENIKASSPTKSSDNNWKKFMEGTL